ncbi:MAG: response regulator transcription factor [Clostridia bacterium]|nr:response regulator transcription factor [Clostridia bacterium]
MIKILIVEDDNEINRLMKDYFMSKGYDVICVFDGIKAVSAVRSDKDISIILLDLMLPFQSGDRVIQKIREFSDLPVIVISAKDTIQTKIDVIRLGADDYVTKPFDLDEILVRVEAVLRRSKMLNNKKLTFQDISLDTQTKTVTISGNIVEMTATEYGILELMMSNPTKLFSKANIFESVWNEDYLGDDSTVKVHISNLRNKIKKYSGKDYIETVWGMGYRLKI